MPQGVLTLVGIEAPLETFDSQGNRTDHGIPFPTTPDAVARTHLGASDAFLARLRLDGNGTGDLRPATILGAFYIDEATGVALDPNNPELVTLDRLRPLLGLPDHRGRLASGRRCS